MKKSLKIIAVILIVVILLVSSWFIFGISLFNKVFPIIKSDNYKITGNMLSYCIDLQKNNYVTEYAKQYGSNYLNSIGLDTQKSLKSQKSSYGGTWFDYFYDAAITQMKENLLLCEAAHEENIKLSEEEIKTIEDSAENVGKFNTRDIISVMKINELAEKYKKSQINSNVSKSEIQKYYNDNRNEFDCVDFKYVDVYANSDLKSNNTTEILSNAKENAYNLKSDIITLGFDAAVSKYLERINSEKNLSDIETNTYKYETDSEFGKWAFSDERKSGDILVLEGKNCYTVFYLIKERYCFDYQTVKAQIISYRIDENNANKSYAAFSKVNKKWQSIEKTEQNFKSLVADSGYVKTYLKSDLTDEQSKWLYNSSRIAGDYAIVEEDNMISLVRFVGVSDSYSNETIKEIIFNNNYNALISKFKSKYKITVKNLKLSKEF